MKICPPGCACKRHFPSPERGARISAARRGKGLRPADEPPTYSSVHGAARKLLAGRECASSGDGTCAGRMQAALRKRVPEKYLQENASGTKFSIRVGDYFPLCQSHHFRYDGIGVVFHGNGDWARGRPKSQATIDKISAALKGRKHPPGCNHCRAVTKVRE
jgi:hypothetical protein